MRSSLLHGINRTENDSIDVVADDRVDDALSVQPRQFGFSLSQSLQRQGET